jgi:hypothetical protein
MYLICVLSSRGARPRSAGFQRGLSALRKIAANDHRLAPGFWWTMSAEAEDAIGCIKTGRWPDPDAAERTTRKRRGGYRLG